MIPSEKRISYATIFVAVAAIFATMTAVGLPNALTYALMVMALILIIISMAVLFEIRLGDVLRGFAKLRNYPLCKNNLEKAWDICKRCIGCYAGVFISVILWLLCMIFDFQIVFTVARVNPWILLIISFVAFLPTALHGYMRRTDMIEKNAKPVTLIITGFLVGLGWLLIFLTLVSFILKYFPDWNLLATESPRNGMM
jgi:uncharacterized membrane protein